MHIDSGRTPWFLRCSVVVTNVNMLNGNPNDHCSAVRVVVSGSVATQKATSKTSFVIYSS